MEKIFERVHKAKTLQHHIRYHPAAHFTIEKAEYLFGMSFCGDYQDFLKKFGFLQINQRRIQGLSQKTPSIYDEDSFLWATRKFREQYIHDPHLSVLENCNDQWYFLLNHANGKLYGFDAIEAKYSGNYDKCLELEKETFSEYLQNFVTNMIR